MTKLIAGYDPRDIARLYGQTHDIVLAAGDALPQDIRATWFNVLGFMRRIPGQPHHRAAPNGVDDKPTDAEVEAFMGALRIHKRRASEAWHKSRGAKRYRVRYVHKIAPKDTDVGDDVFLTEGDIADRKALAAQLRDQRALLEKTRIHEHRVEENGRVVVFPTLPGFTTYWHSVILTPAI